MKTFRASRYLFSLSLFMMMILMPLSALRAQDPVTGAIEGYVFDNAGKAPLAGVLVQIINIESGAGLARRTDGGGHYYQGLLPPGEYRLKFSLQGYVSPPDQIFTNFATQKNEPRPPAYLTREATAVATATPEPSPGAEQPISNPTPVAQPSPAITKPTGGTSIASEINITDARRGDAYTDKEVSTLPLGGTTLTRSFDELGLLVPGVAPPPQTESDIAGPGVGPSIGAAGQFAVNGMRSRANNFMVDGSDNNDEDIGVRRQGFFSLVPQPIESVKEFRIITAIAPAQFGRNFGAQVNALSKSGGNNLHGTLFGLFNSSQLNARNFFDTTNGNGTIALRSSSGQALLDCTGITFALVNSFRTDCSARNRQLVTQNGSGGEDSTTLAQGGFVLGGPIRKDKAFFFVSYETQALNASHEASFAVPTIEERGIFRTGATGLFADCLTADPGFGVGNCTPANSSRFFPEFGVPTKRQGDAVFSLFPFPNNPNGVYGPNTYTELLPASARGNVASGKYDQKLTLWGKPQTLTARYNFTQDWRIVPVTGGALFSSLKPRVRTQNFSTFLTGEITSKLNNVLRVSYGRTRLAFDEVRDPFLIPSETSPSTPFLLNAPRLLNRTINPLPVAGGSFGFTGIPNTGAVLFERSGSTECGVDCVAGTGLGRVGEILVAGFSPMGVDVNFFPQKRVNNTYQIADTLGYRAGSHSLAFGADIRRIELNSDLPRNSRTLLTFNGSPEFDFNTGAFTGSFLTGADYVASGAPSGAFLSLLRSGSSAIGLRYYEYNLFGQDQWKIRRNLSINFGLRYEYNTPPKEMNGLIERTFNDPLLANLNAVGLRTFIAGRSRIFDPDKNNFEPRVGLAWSPTLSKDRATVIRAGFGVFHDQILGAVVTQSRNVFPNFVTVNTSGFTRFDPVTGFDLLTYFNPSTGGINRAGVFVPLIQPGTLNTLNPALPLSLVLDCFSGNATGTCLNTFPPSLSMTLPERRIKAPSAEQYSIVFEQQLTSSLVLSGAFIATRGHNLLRASTPNLGPNNLIFSFATFSGSDNPACFPVVTAGCTFNSLEPRFSGSVAPPGTVATNFDRPVPNVGPVFIYDSGGRSRYNAVQIQLRGRFRRGLQFQGSYTFGNAKDDASDMFDLAGAPALPENSLTRAGEYGNSNFDSRHRIAYNVIYDFPKAGNRGSFYRTVFDGLQIASTGSFQEGQPFTVNSIFDVNLDGNLTDRLNTTQGIVSTGDRRQPIAFDPLLRTSSLLAPVGQDGTLPRNTFRAGNVLNLDLAVIKNFAFSESRRLTFRMDIFNFINRANFGIPVRFLEAPSFGKSTYTVTPGRRIQFGLKFSF